MKLYLAVLFVALTSCASAQSVMEDLSNHLVYFANPESIGSGIQLEGYALTAAHMLPEKKGKLQVFPTKTNYDKHQPMAEVVYLNRESDVMLVKCGWCHGSVTFAHSISIGEPVVNYAYTNGELFLFTGRTCRWDREHSIWFVDIGASFGASGSGVFNTKGELVGIISFIRNLGLGKTVIGVVPAPTVERLIGAYIAKS